MAVEVILPRRGNTVETCLILEWKKNEGDQVKTGDALVEVETDKATFEIESPGDGTLLKTFYPVGEDVPVLSLLALLGDPGEDISGYAAADSAPQAGKAAESETAPVRPGAGPVEAVPPPAAPEAAAGRVPPRAATSRVSRPSGQTASSGKRAISPRARQLAERKGVNYMDLPGSGPGGRIIERDIRQVIEKGQPLTPAAVASATAAAAAGKPATVPPAGSLIGGRVGSGDLVGERAAGATEIPVKGIRAIIAERMHNSLQSTAQFTLHRSADAGTLLDMRSRIKSAPEALGLAEVTVDKMILYAAVRMLQSSPELNSHFLGDRILRLPEIHLGYAVDTPRGLMVPVIRSAGTLSLRQIAAEARRLQTACLEGSILPEELTGGTFTVSNLGMLGIEAFTPVLNVPEVGILGVGGIELKPVRREGEVVFRDHLSLSLTVNHQAVDGGPAAGFLSGLCDMIENFDLLLAAGGEQG